MKPMLWSVRRELWEHRWLWSVPLLIGAVVVAVFSGVAVSHLARLGAGADAELRALAAGLSGIFDLASRMLLMTGTIVALVYCAEALHGERRDRAILFWKSWPVGDGTAVAAKAVVAMLVVPAVTLALLVAAQGIARAVLTGKGIELRAPLASPVAAALEVIGATLWTAPVYAWIMVVSAWARRAVLLRAGLPVLLVTVVEAMVRRDHTIGRALFQRGVGRHWPAKLTLDSLAVGGAMSATPAPELLRSPALWAGVVLAVALLAVAARLRRRMMALS
jgi:ABC-2 type transport system permease protein